MFLLANEPRHVGRSHTFDSRLHISEEIPASTNLFATAPGAAARSYVKRFIFGFGLLGLIGCFLPVALGLSLFDMRHFDSGWHVWLVLGAFALPTYVGAAKSESDAAAAVVGTASFGYLFYKFGFHGTFDLVFHTSIGGVMMGISTLVGLTLSLLALFTTSSK